MATATLSFFEIPADDPERLARFFHAVFGWSSVDVPWNGPRYLRLLPPDSTEKPGGGILARGPGGEPGRGALVEELTVMLRIEGEALEATLERVVASGGTVALAPVAIGESGRFARFADPEGNSFGLWQPLPR